MNKKQLIEAIKDFSDDAQVVVVGGLAEGIKSGEFTGIDDQNAIAWAIGSRTDIIQLEL